MMDRLLVDWLMLGEEGGVEGVEGRGQERRNRSSKGATGDSAGETLS